MTKTLAETLTEIWTPTLGPHARERANNVACWAGDPKRLESPAELHRDLCAAIRGVNRPDYGGKLTEYQIKILAKLAFLAVVKLGAIQDVEISVTFTL